MRWGNSRQESLGQEIQVFGLVSISMRCLKIQWRALELGHGKQWRTLTVMYGLNTNIELVVDDDFGSVHCTTCQLILDGWLPVSRSEN